MNEVAEEQEYHHCGHETEDELVTPHSCPYAEEIHNDSSLNCTCCPSCERECAWDV